MSKLLIYGLVDPRDGLVHYVGKSERGMARANAPYGRKEGMTKRAWLDELRKQELHAQPVILQLVHDEQPPWWWGGLGASALNSAERWWIALGRVFGWPLTNSSDGGNGAAGYRHRPDALAKMRLAASAHWRDPDYRSRVRGMAGRKHSAETRAKIAAKAVGRLVTKETRDKLSTMRRGASNVMKRPEVAAKVAKAARVRLSTPEGRERHCKLLAAAREKRAKR